MQGFAIEAGNTVGVEKAAVTYQTHLYKLGAAAGWSSSQLPINLTRGRYTIEVELKESTTGSIFNLYTPLQYNYCIFDEYEMS